MWKCPKCNSTDTGNFDSAPGLDNPKCYGNHKKAVEMEWVCSECGFPISIECDVCGECVCEEDFD